MIYSTDGIGNMIEVSLSVYASGNGESVPLAKNTSPDSRIEKHCCCQSKRGEIISVFWYHGDGMSTDRFKNMNLRLFQPVRKIPDALYMRPQEVRIKRLFEPDPHSREVPGSQSTSMRE